MTPALQAGCFMLAVLGVATWVLWVERRLREAEAAAGNGAQGEPATGQRGARHETPGGDLNLPTEREWDEWLQEVLS